MALIIKNGNVVDVLTEKVLNDTDVLIEKGKILKIEKNIKPELENTTIIDAKGLFVCPGLIDMHVHLREPGREDKETIQTGSDAAAAGGFTSIACMPNTCPTLDNGGLIRFVKDKAKSASVNVFPVGAITKGLKGEDITEIGDLYACGAVAVSDDGKPVMNSEIMRMAMEYTKMFDIPVLSHCEDSNLAEGGAMNESYYSTILGLKGIPSQAESIMVARDVSLARLTGARVHIQHVSTKESVDIIAFAKKRGLKITAETAPHYFSLTDKDVNFDTNKKMNPPLRDKEDLKAIKDGLENGVIDVIATDHAPHTSEEKDLEFQLAAFGIVGLETAVGVIFTELFHKEKMDIVSIIKKLTINPANILKLAKGSLTVGSDADITIIDPALEWTVKKEQFKSKSRNTPYDGVALKGKAVYTIVAGKVVFKE